MSEDVEKNPPSGTKDSVKLLLKHTQSDPINGHSMVRSQNEYRKRIKTSVNNVHALKEEYVTLEFIFAELLTINNGTKDNVKEKLKEKNK